MILMKNGNTYTAIDNFNISENYPDHILLDGNAHYFGSKFYITVAANTVVTLNVTKKNSGIIWGDGTYDTSSTHTYRNAGDYVLYLDITELGTEAIKPKECLTKVILDGAVNKILSDAFNGYTNLVEAYVSDSVTSIGSESFCDCSALQTLYLGKNITNISGRAFYNTKSLTSLTYNAACVADLESANNIFYNSGIDSTGISLSFGSAVEKIPAYLFFPKESGASSPNAPKITLLNFNDANNLTSIGRSAFYGVNTLKTIYWNNSINNIGMFAFNRCSAIEAIYIKDYEYWNNMTLENPYSNPIKSTTSVYLNDQLITALQVKKSINAYVWNGYSKLESVAFSNTATIYIGKQAFMGCSNLSSLTFSDYITEIQESAFKDCTSLKTSSTSFPKYLETIGSQAFSGCKSISGTVNISDRIKSIGSYAFSDCSSITTFSIGDSPYLKEIEAYTFKNCTSLTNLYLWQRITSMPANAINGCINLTYNTYNNSKYLGSKSGNPYLVAAEFAQTSNVVAHNSTVIILSNAFKNFENYTSSWKIGSLGKITKIDSSFFKFDSAKYLKGITIPSTVKLIEPYSFDYCLNLDNNTATEPAEGAIFEKIAVWRGHVTSDPESEYVSIDGLSDQIKAATYLKKTYKDYYWILH